MDLASSDRHRRASAHPSKIIRISGLSQSPLAGHAPSSFLFLVPDRSSSAGPLDGSERRACPELSLPQPGCCEDRSVPQGRLFGEDISDIVKRECGRWGREICQPWRSCSASIRWWIRKRICHWSFCDRVRFLAGILRGSSPKKTDIDHESDQVP